MKLSLFGLALISAVVTARSTEDVNTAWENFKVSYGREYRDLYEELVRKAIFVENFNEITAHNERYEQGLVTYFLNINKYSDMSSEEFKNTMNGYKKSASSVPKIEIARFVPDKNVEIPDTFDWRPKGAVTPVKDQGHCGSCWAFSSTGALEGQYFLKTGKLVSISEQNLMDCSGDYDNESCNGGDMDPAFEYVHDNDGIDSEEAYPYQGVDSSCRYVASANVTSTKGYATIKSGSEDYLKAAVATIGPIAVAMDASRADFQHYAGGIYYHEGCYTKSNQLDHAVLAVGYGAENGLDYWLVKNSWGTSWGIDGYIKMSRNRNNNCGIATDATFPLNY